MSNICAGIGLGQMEILQERITKRRQNNNYYRDAFQQTKGIMFLTEPSERYYSNYWLTTILIEPSDTNGVTSEDVYLKLKDQNIEARPLWKPMHLQPIFAPYPSYINGVSESLFNKGLCLPSGSLMTDTQREYVAETVLRSFG